MKKQRWEISPGVWTALILVLALGAWEAAAAGGHVNEFFFSRPSHLWQEFWDMIASGMLARHLSTTAKEAGLGLLFGGVLGTLGRVSSGEFSPGKPGFDAPDDRSEWPAKTGFGPSVYHLVRPGAEIQGSDFGHDGLFRLRL